MQKQPAHHCLKSSGLPIGRCIGIAGTSTSTVSAATHPILLHFVKPGLESFKGKGLSIRPHLSYNGTMKLVGTPRLLATPQTLVQLPNRIAEPGELQWAKLSRS